MTRARLGALALVLAVSVGISILLVAPASAQGPALERGVLVVLVPEISFEDLMAYPEVSALATMGGAGLYPARFELENVLTDGFRSQVYPLPTGHVDLRLTIVKQGLGPSPAPRSQLGEQIRATAEELSVERILVIVVGVGRSARMQATKDELLPIVLGVGDPSTLFETAGDAHGLTSDSTRRAGVVVGEDVVTTILAFDGGRVPGHPRPDGSEGSPIRTTDEPAPFELHERYLAQRRMYVPIGTAAALYTIGAGLVAIALTARTRTSPRRWRRVVGWVALSIPMLATGMLATGHLPDLSYATAVPMIAIVAGFGTMAFSPLERRDPTLVLAGIGGAVLALGAVEAVLGWSGMLTPLLGGGQLDGGRFYGLPNVTIGLLVASALWVAQRLRTLRGFALLYALGLFAGLPLGGANLGGAVTAFAAAGLWVAVRERARLGIWKGLVVFAGVTASGTAIILLAHAVSPVVTHVTRFEQSADGLAGILEKFGERLQVGFDLIARSPGALIPVLGLPAVLFVVLRPPAVIRETFARWPAWRDAVLVTVLAGFVAYLVNDSGASAIGLAFGLGLGGMLGVSLLAGEGKMAER